MNNTRAAILLGSIRTVTFLSISVLALAAAGDMVILVTAGAGVGPDMAGATHAAATVGVGATRDGDGVQVGATTLHTTRLTMVTTPMGNVMHTIPADSTQGVFTTKEH